jgi:hypothetical protein
MYKENYTLIQVDRTITVDMAYSVVDGERHF